MAQTIDLKERLSQATKPFDPVEEYQPPAEESPEEFHQEPTPPETETEPQEAEPETEPEESDFIDMAPEDTAELLIGGLNFLQTRTIRNQIKKRFKASLSKEEFSRLEALATQEKKSKSTTYTESDLELISKLREFEEKMESIPFQDDETDLLRKPLIKVLAKYNMKLTPEWALVFAAGQIMAPRIIAMSE